VPHLPQLGNAEATADARATLESLQPKLGQVPNMYRTFAHAPKTLSAAVSMAQAIRTELAPKLRELAYLKVTDNTACHVCRHHHGALGRRAGLTAEQIRDPTRSAAGDAYSEHEKNVLRFAE
jgi:AhpD family alkylhydroperoxidase